MNILLIGAVTALTIYFVGLGRTGAAAKDLITTFKKAQIYKFVDGGSMTVRMFVDFVNLHNAAITITKAYLKCQLDGITIGVCDVENVVIQPGTNNKYFDLVMPWGNLGVAAAIKVGQWFSTGTLTPPQACTITGELKCKGFIINVNKTIPFSTTAN